MAGFTHYSGTLTRLSDDLYESKADDAWVQVQLTEEGIDISTSHIYWDGSYTRN